jgi:hypothetical protein
MMKRIREQLEAGAGFKAAGVLKVSANAVLLPSSGDTQSLEDLVQVVADRIGEMAMLALGSKSDPGSANGSQQNEKSSNPMEDPNGKTENPDHR